jgi:two-component system, OmpR family, response regulator CpxR
VNFRKGAEMNGFEKSRNTSLPTLYHDCDTINRMKRVLIVDDDRGLVSLLERFLQKEGFQVESAFDHDSGLQAARSGEYDAIILDVMLPGGSGFDLLKSLRSESLVPVLLLTARGESVDRILGLEIGADDYVPKPFDPRELVARIRAVLRRTAGSHAEEILSDESLTVGDITLALNSRTSLCNGVAVELTGAEFNMLELLLRRAGKVVTREELAQAALGRPLSAFDRSVDVHVSRLRRKLLACAPGHEERIRPVRGIGYFYSAPRSIHEAASQA